MHWIYFIGLAVVGYIGIAFFNRMVGGETQSFYEAITVAFRPLPLIVMIAANVILGGAVYFGFLATSSAIPIMLSVGVVVTFLYSVLLFGVGVTITKLFGIGLIILGIYLLR